jgi:hypothetical protein
LLIFFEILFSLLILFFARPKKSIQKKGRPASRLILRFSKQAGPSRTRPPKSGGLKQLEGLIRLFLRCSARHDGDESSPGSFLWAFNALSAFSPTFPVHFFCPLRILKLLAEAGVEDRTGLLHTQI